MSTQDSNHQLGPALVCAPLHPRSVADKLKLEKIKLAVPITVSHDELSCDNIMYNIMWNIAFKVWTWIVLCKTYVVMLCITLCETALKVWTWMTKCKKNLDKKRKQKDEKKKQTRNGWSCSQMWTDIWSTTSLTHLHVNVAKTYWKAEVIPS